MTAHDLNQPLTVLLGSICLIKMDKDNPEKISQHLEKIEESGKRISATVRKIQSIRYDKSQHFLGGASCRRLDQGMRDQKIADQNPELLKFGKSEDSFKNLNDLFRLMQSRFNGTAA